VNVLAAESLAADVEALGVSVAFLVNVLDPEIIIVGCGLGMAGGLYWDTFQRSCREHIFADNSCQVPIVSAKFGIDAGIVGAAAAVFAKQQTQKTHFAHEKN